MVILTGARLDTPILVLNMSKSAENILRIISPLFVVGLGIALYSGALKAPFTDDDVLVALESPQAYDSSNALRYLFHDLDWVVPENLDQASNSSEKPSRFGLYRPLLITSIIIDTFLWHHDPFGWRLTNLILFLTSALLVLGLSIRFLGSRIGGLTAALLFVAHPIHIEAVVSLLGGRAELLAFICLAAAWWLFLGGDKRSGARRWAGDIGSACLFMLGLWSKENAIVLPGILFLAGWSIRGQSFRTLIIRLVPHILVFGVYMAIRLSVVGRVAANDWSLAFGDASFVQIFLTMMTVMAMYLRLAILPYPILHPDCYRNMPATVSLPEGVFCAVLVLGLIGAAGWLLILSRKRGRPLFWAFSLLLFYGCLVPVSQIVPFRVIMATRFLYLPSLALCLLAGHLAMRVYEHRRWILAAAGVPLLAAYSLGTLVTIPDCIDLDRMYSMVIKCDPGSPSPYNNLGTYRLRKGKPAEALPFFRKALTLDPGYSQALYNLAYTLSLMKRNNEAETAYHETLAVDPSHDRAWNNLGILLQVKGNIAGASECFERAIDADPRQPAAFVNLGSLEQRQGDFTRAEKHFRLALKIAPRLTEARFNLGRLLEQTGRGGEAERQYLKIINNRPDYAMAHNNLANIIKERGLIGPALEHYLAAIEADPNCLAAHYNLGKLLLSTRKPQEAEKHFEIVTARQPGNLDAWLGLAYARLDQGKIVRAREAAAKAAGLAPAEARVKSLLDKFPRPGP